MVQDFHADINRPDHRAAWRFRAGEFGRTLRSSKANLGHRAP
jgi:hypothetical protein